MVRRLVVVVPSIADNPRPWQSLLTRLRELDGYRESDCDLLVVSHGARWYRPGRAARPRYV
ncbi:hypothetical protein [Streptomyces chartreusis]